MSPLRTSSMKRWNVCVALLKPNGSLVNSKSPKGVETAVLCTSFSSTGTIWYPRNKSKCVKIVLPCKLAVGGWNKIYPNGTKFTHFLSPYSELPMRFRHQKFKKSDRLVKKLSCNTGLHIIFPVYILNILLPKNYF